MDPELNPCRNPDPRLGCHRVGVEVGVGSSGGGGGGGVWSGASAAGAVEEQELSLGANKQMIVELGNM